MLPRCIGSTWRAPPGAATLYVLRCSSLPVSVALLLMMASSWLRGRILALFPLGRRGTRVAATSGLVAQHSQRFRCDWSYPPLTLTGLL
jgi:hypothetical protein